MPLRAMWQLKMEVALRVLAAWLHDGSPDPADVALLKVWVGEVTANDAPNDLARRVIEAGLKESRMVERRAEQAGERNHLGTPKAASA